MPTVHKQVTPVKEIKICDECLKGEMKNTEMVILTDPPKYRHRCNNCSSHRDFSEIYPRIIYEEVK